MSTDITVPEAALPKATSKVSETAHRMALAMGVHADEVEKFIAAVGKAARALNTDARAELKFRLNEQLQGRDPGPSVNWPGERGL